MQIAGGPAFRPVAIGNSRHLSRGAAVAAVGSAGLTRTFTLDIGNLASGTGVLAGGGQRLTGLLVSTARVVAGEETGGPLVNLSGQAIGINVAGTGSGLHHAGRGSHRYGSRRGQADPGHAFAVSRRIYAIPAQKCHVLASWNAEY